MLHDRELLDLREQLRQKMQAAGTLRPLPKDGRADRREQAANDKAYLLKTYCPHYFPHDFSPRHQAALQHCDIMNRLYFLSAHREWGKSAIGSFGDQIDKICNEKRHFLLMVSNTVDIAEPYINALKMEFEENSRLRQDFGDLVGSRTWTSTDFVTRNNRRMLGRGIFQPFRGLRHGPYRPDDATCDDTENDQTAESPKQSAKIMRRLWKAVRPALRRKKDGGWSLKWIGTPITKLCVTYQLMHDTQRRMIKDVIPLVDADGNLTWPEVYDWDEVDAIKAEDLEAWYSEYLLDPLDDEEQVFRGRIQWLASEADLPKFVTGDVTEGGVDPSFGEEGCYKAVIMLTGQRSTMNIYCRHAYIRKGEGGTPRKMCEAIATQQAFYGGAHDIEENSLKSFLWEAVDNYEKDEGVHLRLHGITHGAGENKDKRILTLLSPAERNKLYLIRGHSDQEVLGEQFDEFPKGYKDGPDGFEVAYKRVMKKLKCAGRKQQMQGHGRRETAGLDLTPVDFAGYL